MMQDRTTTNEATAGTTMQQGFGERSLMKSAETHQAALAAAAQASVNARFIQASLRPRNWDDVRVRLLRECERPGFAEVARYRKPIGKGVEGPSIRFAEACLRYAGNLDAPVTTTYEDRFKRILHVAAIDYETNAGYSKDITIEKTVERSSGKDRVVVGERRNSRGDVVFIVEATEDELLNKENALVSKAVRTQILRLIPGDIIEEAQEKCLATLRSRATKDPEGEKRRIFDAFAGVGVFPKDLEQLLGHGLDAVQPAELVDLRKLFAALKDGEATWAQILEAKKGAPAGAGGTSSLEEKLRAKAAKKAKAAAAPPATAAPMSAEEQRAAERTEQAEAKEQREPGEEG